MADLINVNHLLPIPADSLGPHRPILCPMLLFFMGISHRWLHQSELMSLLPFHLSLPFTRSHSKHWLKLRRGKINVSKLPVWLMDRTSQNLICLSWNSVAWTTHIDEWLVRCCLWPFSSVLLRRVPPLNGSGTDEGTSIGLSGQIVFFNKLLEEELLSVMG